MHPLLPKRAALLLALALTLSACATKAPRVTPAPPQTAPAPVADETPDAGEAPVAGTEPPTPVRIHGPIYLFGEPDRPRWDGPVAVSIDNNPAARPQSGIRRADVIIEALAEGEITRFLPLLWSDPGDEPVGPVRSARQYFVDIARAHRAPLAHAGGSVEALRMLREPGHKDLDEIYNSGAFFYRDETRDAPHNLYLTAQSLLQSFDARGFAPEPVPLTPRADPASPPDPPARQITVTWHPLHRVVWQWDGTAYVRLCDGEPHLLADGLPIASSSLVFLQVSAYYQGSDHGWRLELDAGGTAHVITAAGEWKGTWALGDGGFVLLPADDAEVPPLPTGTVWVHLMTDASTYELDPQW